MDTARWRLVDVAVGPLDGPDAWQLHGIERVERAAMLAERADTDDVYEARDLAVELAHQEDHAKIWAVAVDGDRPEPSAVIGAARVTLPVRNNLTNAYIDLTVHPDQRGHGVGSTLLAWVEDVAAAAGRTSLLAFAAYGEPADGVELLRPTTGSGLVPAVAGVRFGTARGYAIEQAERRSTLTIPPDARVFEQHAAQAREHAAGYRTHVWREAVPDAWLDAFALLETRMSTDAPIGGLDLQEDAWDGARVRRIESELCEAGRSSVITAAEHVATGELAAMTQLTWSTASPRDFAFQWDTIVLRPHRGHRLGMLVKAVNLQQLVRIVPGVRRVHTWNAAENSYMLAINVALGFRPAGGAATLQKRLPG
jgi:GNAT superfamily N-acetyltransferase